MKLVSYTYDAWGNFTTTYHNSGSLTKAKNNPFTYRGYYFDSDLDFYYLGTRYYDAKLGRFVNSDGVLGANEDFSGYNLFSYCGNDPINRIDYGGQFWDYVLDAVFIGIGVADLIEDPSWSKAAWLALDVTLAVIPFIPALSGARHLSKADDVVDVAKAANKVDNFADAGGAIRKANKADFIDNGWDLVQSLDKTEDGFTISNKFVGTQIHTKFNYEKKSINFANRVDGFDRDAKIIYELKPNNPRSIRQGKKQLLRYQNAALHKYQEIYQMILVLY